MLISTSEFPTLKSLSKPSDLKINLFSNPLKIIDRNENFF